MANRGFDQDHLLDLLYTAATDAAGWPHFLGALTGMFCAQWASLLETPTAVPPLPQALPASRIAEHFGIPADARNLYDTFYAAKDPWFLAVQRRKLTEWIGLGSELCPPARFERTEFYNEFFRAGRYPAFYQLGVMLSLEGGPQAVLTILRDRRQKDFGKNELRRLQTLKPHLRRALEIRRKTTGLRQAAEGAGDLMASVDLGLIGLDGACRVRFTNSLAEEVLRVGGKILSLRSGYLAAADAQESARLERLLRATVSGAWKTRSPGGSLTIHSGDRSLHLSVLPAAGLGHLRAFVTFSDPNAPPRSRHERLAALFNLTPAEVRVAMLLLEGLDLRQISERTAASYETVRSQIKSVYRKLGVKRQSQMVRLLSMLPGSC